MDASSLIPAITGAATALIGNYIIELLKAKNTYTSEQYKIQLKKSEIFFQKQFEASLEFGKFFYEVLPKKQSILDEWEDAMKWLADDLNKHKIFIDDFVSKYSVLFNSSTIELIENVSYQVVRMNDDKDLHEINSGNDLEWEDKKWKYADEFYDELKKANEAIRNEVREQVKI